MGSPIFAMATAQPAPAVGEHELHLIRSSIALLASGGARRVTLVGLPLTDQALREIGILVRGSGLVLRAQHHSIGFDITLEGSG